MFVFNTTTPRLPAVGGSHSDQMYSKRPLIEMDQRPRRDRKHPWKPHYVLMDLTSSPHGSESAVLVICDNQKPKQQVSKKTMFVTAMLAAFVLGFSLGTVIPLYLGRKQTASSVSTKGTVEGKNILYFKNSSLPGTEHYGSVLQDRLVKGILWSDLVERSLPVGFGDEDDRQWRSFVQKNTIVRIEKGCGRMQNRLVTFEDGTKACCRYRQNTDQIQGEIYSYYLGRSLQLRNLVPSTLVVVNSSDPLWMPVRAQLAASQWQEEHPVVLTEFVEDLVPARIPTALRHFTNNILASGGRWEERFNQENSSVLRNTKGTRRQTIDLSEWVKSEKDAVEMAQWSDLIIFDYLTANLDRIVNNMYNLQWNPGMMSSPAHNLARAAASDLLVFLDNESGLLHGYRLLDKYESYHSLLLDGLCVFRESTVAALSGLNLHNPLALGYASTADLLPPLPDKNVDILAQRVARVLRQVVSCGQRTVS